MRWFLLPILLALLAGPAGGNPLGPSGTALAAPPGAGSVELGEVLRVLGEEYEAHERLQPGLLVDGALQAASEAIPPLLVERSGEALRVRVGAAERRFELPADADLTRLGTLLGAVRDFIVASLAPRDVPPHLNALLAEGLLHALDPHSGLLSAAAFGDFQSKASGRIGGLGMLLAQQEQRLTVESVLPDSPAERAGVQAGDRLLQIGDQPALHLPVEEALGLIRGRIGSKVGLLILRPGEAVPRPLLLRRTDLHFASVSGRVLREGGHDRIGYVRVRSFQESTTAELTEQLQHFQVGSPGLLGIVLDLRDNPGGMLEQAIRVADLFLDRGTIVTLRGPRIQSGPVLARWYRSISSAPLIVLVNGGTASAAEIVAGALKYNHRALLVGEPTFGKNSVQSVFPLSGGNALKLTVARFYPPGGRSGEEHGILPHLWLRPVRLQSAPPRYRGLLATATGLSVGGAEGAIAAAGEVPGNSQPVRELPYLEGDASAGATAPDGATAGATTGGTVGDYALGLARRLLLLNAPQGQAVLLNQALDWALQERRRQDQAIAQRLASEGVDWRPGHGDDGGPVELLRVELETRPAADAAWAPLPEGAGVPGGGELRLVLTLRNAGVLPLHRVLVVAQSAAPELDGLELPVGHLPAGETVQVRAEVALPADLPQGLEPLRLRIYDGQRRLHYRATVLIPLAAPPPSRLRIELAAFDDGSGGSRGNGDGRAQAGEVLALRVRVRNEGSGPSGSGRYWLGGEAGEALRLLHPWRAFASLPPGGAAIDFLLLELGGPPLPAALALRLNLMSDRLSAQELSWSFSLRPGEPLPRLALQAPQVDLTVPATPLAASRVLLLGRGWDEAGLRDLALYRNGRKVQVVTLPPGAGREQPLRIELELEPGRNLLRIVARNGDGLLGSRSYLLWQGAGGGFPIGTVTAAGGS